MSVGLKAYIEGKWVFKGRPYNYSINMFGKLDMILNVDGNENISLVLNPWYDYDHGIQVSMSQ